MYFLWKFPNHPTKGEKAVVAAKRRRKGGSNAWTRHGGGQVENNTKPFLIRIMQKNKNIEANENKTFNKYIKLPS